MRDSLSAWCLKFLWFWALMTFSVFVVVAAIRLLLGPVTAWLTWGRWQWLPAEMTIRYLLSSFSIGLMVAAGLTSQHWYALGRENRAVKWIGIAAFNAAACALIFGVINPYVKVLAKGLVDL